MIKFLLIAIPIFSLFLFIFYKATIHKVKAEYGKREWNLWGSKTWYWQWAVIFCGALTYLIVSLLKWGNIVSF